MIYERDTYLDRPILRLRRYDGDKYPLSIGLRRAKMIVEAIDDIRAFVKENDEKHINHLFGLDKFSSKEGEDDAA